MKRIAALWTSLIMGAALLSGCQSGLLRKATGSVAVEREQVAGQMPTRSPSIIYVTDFALDAVHFQEDQGVRGLLPSRLRERASSRLEAAIPGPLTGTDPVVQARHIVNALTDALVKSLSEKGMPAKALNPAAETMPHGGWMVIGVFTEVDEGNRIKRATIGFGRGATHMDAQVMVTDLSSRNPTAPFAIFGTVKAPGEIPGAMVTMNPYVAAAKFVMEKDATRKDIEKTAGEIATEILKLKGKTSLEP